jgi:three-Cys-motif partner protein
MSKSFNSKQIKWGGSWTEMKLEAFTKYVNSYLTIMNRYRDKFNWKLIYFDGFAGSGCREESMDDSNFLEKDSLLFDVKIEEDDFSVYKCAAERILNIEQSGFDFYYFIDINKASNDALKARLLQYKKPGIQLVFRNEDANLQIRDLAHALNNTVNLRALVLLDPFGMQLDWISIERLAHTKIDLWILIPTGVIVNRLLDKKMELVYIAKLYISKLKTIFEEVSDEPLVLLNTKNVPIYHFAFASSNATAKKIATEIIGSM